MSTHYFGKNQDDTIYSPTYSKWIDFIEPIKSYYGSTSENDLWNTKRDSIGTHYATSLSDIYIRTESHGTSAYGQTNYRNLYSEINENTQTLIEALEGNYFEYTDPSHRICAYLWNDSDIHFSYTVSYNTSESGEIIDVSSIFNYQPRILGIDKTSNCPYDFKIIPNDNDSDTYTKVGINSNGFNIYGGHGYNTDTNKYDKVICNIPIFAEKSKAEDYIENGFNSSNTPYLINRGGETPSEEEDNPTKVYYYNMTLLHNGVNVAHRSFRVDIKEGKVGAFKIEGNDPYNIGFLANNRKVEKVIYYDDETGTTNYNSWNSFINAHGTNEWSYIEYSIGSSSDYYETNVTTNIPLWKDENDAQKYLDNELTLEDSLSQGKNLSTLAIRTGTGIDKTDNNTVPVSGSNRAFKINESDLNGICGELWSTDEDVWSRILDGTHITNNPIDFIVNCFKFPFNIGNYCVLGSSEEIKLGGYGTGISDPSINGIKPTQIASAFIKPIFNNFLDYSNVNLFLYLPYCGLSQLDFKMVLSTLLTIDVVVDPFNGSMKYYVKSDGKLIEEHGCNVGMSVPLIGSDSASKSREIVDSQTQVINNIVGGTQGVTNAISSSVNIVNMMNQIESEPVMITKGNNSPSTGLCDVDYPFLIFDVQEAIQPELLYTKYGYPCNRIVQMNKCQGWCELNDIQLVGTMLEDEKSEIVSMMTSGVIF